MQSEPLSSALAALSVAPEKVPVNIDVTPDKNIITICFLNIYLL